MKHERHFDLFNILYRNQTSGPGWTLMTLPIISFKGIINTRVEAILPLPCVPIYKRLDDKNISQEGF